MFLKKRVKILEIEHTLICTKLKFAVHIFTAYIEPKTRFFLKIDPKIRHYSFNKIGVLKKFNTLIVLCKTQGHHETTGRTIVTFEKGSLRFCFECCPVLKLWNKNRQCHFLLSQTRIEFSS